MRNVEDAEGNLISLNVAQYISYDLSLDDLSFANPLYNRILAEAVEHSVDEGFKAEEYFTRHPDIEVSTVAVAMSVEEFKLSESLQLRNSETILRNRVLHLVLDFRMDYVENKLKELRAQLSQVAGNVEQMMNTMGEIKKMQDIRNLLARKLGNDIVV